MYFSSIRFRYWLERRNHLSMKKYFYHHEYVVFSCLFNLLVTLKRLKRLLKDVSIYKIIKYETFAIEQLIHH